MPVTDAAADLAFAGVAVQAEHVRRGVVSSRELVELTLSRIDALDPELRAFVALYPDSALADADRADARRARGEPGALLGVPIAVKDEIDIEGEVTARGTDAFTAPAPADAEVIRRLRDAGAVLVGKTAMPELGLWPFTQSLAWGVTRNPWDLERTPGGSRGGSSAALAAYEAPLAIGTDTGGSIRQPAAVTGTVGVKPTYGGVSRYGIVALASSLDQAGPCARTVLDAALLHTVIGGHDPRDSTSVTTPLPDVVAAARRADVRGLRVGVVRELGGEGYQAGVRARFDEAVEVLAGLGADVVEVSCPHFPYALAAYYLILPSEASSNLARFDGMRYGLRVTGDGDPSVEQVMARTRAAGFGDEAVRRIILGTYALSAGYYDAYYGQAQKVRTLVQRDFAAAFAQADVLVSPTAPTTAFRLGEKLDDPLAMYLNDIATIPANLAGTPGLSVPVGLAPEDGLPVGLQVMAPALADDRMYNVAAALEAALQDRWGRALHEEVPEL